MNTWIPVTQAFPPMLDRSSSCLWPASATVLVWAGQFCLATLEQIDEDSLPGWYTFDSERWGITGLVSHWMDLPPAP